MKQQKFLQVMGAVVSALAVATAGAQSATRPTVPIPEWQTRAGGKMEFDVVSVKPSAPDTPFSFSTPANGLDGPPPGSLFHADAILMAYLLFAFKINDSNQGQALFRSLPDWGKTEFYTVEARAEGSPTRDQMRLMVQALLADRFKLSMHREMQQRVQYALVLSKPPKLGPQLREHPATETCKPDDGKLVDAAPPPNAPRTCGTVIWNVNGQHHMRLTDMTMAQVANYLSSTGAALAGGPFTPRTGLDETGLRGRYDLDLQFAPDANDAETPAVAGPVFADTLKNQLGLKLVERKGSVELLVIDHLEKPSAN